MARSLLLLASVLADREKYTTVIIPFDMAFDLAPGLTTIADAAKELFLAGKLLHFSENLDGDLIWVLPADAKISGETP